MYKAVDVDRIIRQYKQTYINKYFDIFCSLYDIKGFDYRYLKKLRSLLFSKGSAWIRADNITGDAICCDYTETQFD